MEYAGWKLISDQYSSYPYVGHLHFGDKKDLLLPDRGPELIALGNYLSGNKHKYCQFLRRKARHPSLDIYACFQPFNEAFKALFPFVNYIGEQLKPGDTILNLWDRSGWTASMLAGWFPEQEIVTVWEGDKDILGYKGFNYWMSRERRQNHTVLFADFLRPLPIESNSVSAIIGMDLLHRFQQPELLAELHRIAKSSAAIVFPHVHLTNSEPDPFFERGMRQLHGKDYDFLFSQVSKSTGRSGFVLSEPVTFSWNDFSPEKKKILCSEPDHKDYNACVAWLPAGSQPYLQPWRGHEKDWMNMYLLQNPLLAIDPVSQKIVINEKLYGPLIEELLERHSVYARRIQKSIGKKLDQDIIEVLYWAIQGLSLKNIMGKTNIKKSRIQEILETAWNLELAQAVPVDETGFRLQTLLGHQKYILEKKENDLKSFWQQAVHFYADETWVKTEEGALTYTQADELIVLLQKALLHEGLRKSDKILICGDLHPESMLIFWAAVSLGMIVVPISSKEASQRIQDYVNIIQPSIAFVDPSFFTSIHDSVSFKVIMTDQLSDPAYNSSFSFDLWLSSSCNYDAGLEINPEPDDIAVILWTTGSTDNPKGIPISHAQLIRSGRVMTETYQWKKTDRYFALGGLECMSSLRHATVAIAEVGACCIVPGWRNDINDQFQTIVKENVSIVTANPLFFMQLLSLTRRVPQNPRALGSIRLALSTGNKLSQELRIKWKKQTGTSILNYYGLTETTGICIAEPPGFESSDDGSIGSPIDCLVKIIDEKGRKVPTGVTGELCIYGAAVFGGYYQNEKASLNSLKNGWFHTKDLAFLKEDGSLCLCGRLSDIVKLPSGQRIELSAVEEVIRQIPELSDWTVCALCENEKESIAIFIVPAEMKSTEDLITSIKARVAESIGSYAIPTLIETVDHIPRGNHNKVLRKELLNNYFEMLK